MYLFLASLSSSRSQVIGEVGWSVGLILLWVSNGNLNLPKTNSSDSSDNSDSSDGSDSSDSSDSSD